MEGERIALLLTGARAARQSGDPVQARALARLALDRARQAGSAPLLADALNSAAQTARDAGDPDTAIAHYHELAALKNRAADRPGEVHALRHIADIHRQAGRPEAAHGWYERVLHLYPATADAEPLPLANARRGYALLLESQGAIEAAAAQWQAARMAYEAAGVSEGVAECDRHLHEGPVT